MKVIISSLLALQVFVHAEMLNISEEENRLIDSMSFEELLNTEIATGTPVAQKFAPAVTSIITADEIRRNGVRTLHEALESVPGLHIYPSDLNYLTQSISIRGIHTGINAQVLILMDGVSLTGISNSNPGSLFRLPSSLIHRIEVIRGPGSALYGADSFSGVVNIISKKSYTIEDEVGMRYGSFKTWEAWVHKRAEIGELNIGLAISMMKSDGDNDRIIQKDVASSLPFSPSLAPGALSTRYDMAYLHADASYKEFDFNLLVEKSEDLGVGGGAARILDPTGFSDRDRVILDLQHTNTSWLDDTKIKTKLIHKYINNNTNFIVFPAGTTLGTHTFIDGAHGNPVTKDKYYSASINAIHRGIVNHTISTAIGYSYQKIEPNQRKNFGPGVVPGVFTDVTNMPNVVFQQEHSRKSYFAFIQDEFTINDKLNFTSGIRYDNYNDFGSTINPRLALVWQHSDDITIKTMYGRAFRAPSFGEQYLINNPTALGNPDLDPETIDTFEISLNYRIPVHTRVNLFYYKAKDMINYVLDTTTKLTTAQNSKDQTGYGLELELEYSVSESLSLRGNYAYQHSVDDETKKRVEYAPVHQAYTQIQYTPSFNWNVNAQYHYIGKRHRVSTDAREVMSGDSLVNLTIEKKNIINGLDLLVSARNLFDIDYREPSNGQIGEDYPMAGRYLFGEIRYQF